MKDTTKVFPYHGVTQYGMELRDLFASISFYILMNTPMIQADPELSQPDNIATYSYKCADAMMRAREAEK